MTGDPILSVRDLEVYYNTLRALNDVSFEINEGETLGIIGPNGAGKTTLLNAISGMKKCEGDITYRGEDVAQLSPRELTMEGLIHCPEARHLYPHFTVEENLLMGGYNRPKDEVNAALDQVYEQFPRLDERDSQIANTLSGGERQMLAIGRALMGDPDLLLIDEPTQGLAPKIIETIRDILQDLGAEDMTILLTEQNSTFAMNEADRLCLLENGEIEMRGTAADFREDDYIRDAYVGIQ